MADIYKKCLVCGKEFKVCKTCLPHVPEELQWRRVVCCSSHFNYHLPIIRYVRDEISKEQARTELLEAIELYGEIEFADNIKPIVDEILKVERKKSKKKEIVAEETVSADEIIE